MFWSCSGRIFFLEQSRTRTGTCSMFCSRTWLEQNMPITDIYASSENSNNAIAYYKVDKKNEVDICDFDVGFKWKVFKDDCEGDYYLYSLGYNDWLNASPRGIWTDPRGLMEHKKCEYFEFYADGGCGKARAFKFTEITLISN